MEGAYKRFKGRTASYRARPRASRRPVVARRAGRLAASRNRVAAYRARRYRHNRVTMGMIGVELKYFDETFSGPIVSSATAAGGQCPPSVTECIFCPIVGDGPSNRDGRKVRLKSIQIRGRIVSDGFAAAGLHPSRPPVVVGYLIKDTQCNGVLADSDIIFENTIGGSDATQLSFRDLATSSRFKILKKQIWHFNNIPFTTNNTNPPTAFYVRGFEKDFEWNINEEEDIDFALNAGSANTVANLTRVNYIPVFFTNNATGTTSLVYASRCRFVG